MYKLFEFFVNKYKGHKGFEVWLGDNHVKTKAILGNFYLNTQIDTNLFMSRSEMQPGEDEPVNIISFSNELDQRIQDISLFNPFDQPMLCKPLEWRSFFGGGYLSNKGIKWGHVVAMFM